ncbi:hypothetical protein J5X84_28030 [Streptosporangiaceae bacterium NEAU-GS5]|nr:hypothetical protein [Streptosporangiaceae bacterium NEAU-GS5]
MAIDLAGLLQGVLKELFGVVTKLSPPVLVHPVLGRVYPRLDGFWPRGSSQPAPPRLLTPRTLRGFLVGAGADSQALGKLALLGLPVDLLQETWSDDGTKIGAAALQIVADAQPNTLIQTTLTTAAVGALWRLNPFESGPPADAAAVYADLMAAALTGHADDPAFRTAAAGRPVEEVIEEGRAYLAGLATDWLTAVQALVVLSAAQQAEPAGRDFPAELDAIVAAYNATSAPDSPFLEYVAGVLLGGHPATTAMPDDPGDDHFADVLRAAILHTAAGGLVREDGDGTAAAAAATPAPVGNAILDSAFELADQLTTYAQDEAGRWADDQADCSSFVQRALFAAGTTAFDPGPDHTNALTSHALAGRDDLFDTVPRSGARPGDVLVQGALVMVDGTMTWKGHCGLFLQPAADDPDVLEGASMDAVGPVTEGRWGVGGSYAYGENLLVRRLKEVRKGGPALPFADFSAADPAVTASNDAKRFAGFSLAKVHWQDADSDADARPAVEATALGIHYTVRQNHGPAVLALSPGAMACAPPGDGTQRVRAYLAEDDVARVRRTLSVDNVRFVWELSADQGARFAASMRTHHGTGHLRPVLLNGQDEPYERMLTVGPVTADLDRVEQIDVWARGEGPVLFRPAEGVRPEQVELLRLRAGEKITLYAEVMTHANDVAAQSWYRVNAGSILDALRRDGTLEEEYDLLTEVFRDGGVASGGPAGSRGELVALWGGSRDTLILQPAGVVPAALFSFATCDVIQIFAPALAVPPDRPIGVRTSLPTIPRAALAQLWARYAVTDRFTDPGAGYDFPATDYATEITSADPGQVRGLAFHDEVARVITYGPAGEKTGAYLHGGTSRKIIPHSDPASRPDHPQWQVKRVPQLLRLYPLRYTLKVGDAPEFAITQDDVDCARQEYVFHMDFTDGYFQTYAGIFKPADLPRLVFPTTDPGNPHGLELAGGRPVLPALGANKVIVVPTRSEIRPLTLAPETRGVRHSTGYHYTRLTAASDDLVETARVASERYALGALDIVHSVLGNTPLPVTTLPDYAARAVVRITRLISAPPPALGSIDGVLYEALMRGGNPLATFADLADPMHPRLWPYTLQISSGWRSPEHNETVSKVPTSNHQLGVAMDIQPKKDRGQRNPLALLCLHLSAQDHLRAHRVRECLLEFFADEYVVGAFPRDLVDMTFREQVTPHGVEYVLHSSAGDQPMSVPDQVHEGDQLAGSRGLHPLLIKTFRTAWDATHLPWPEPTYLDVYVFALARGSHVHHTWVL